MVLSYLPPAQIAVFEKIVESWHQMVGIGIPDDGDIE